MKHHREVVVAMKVLTDIKKNVYIVYGKRRFLSSVETVMSAITSLCVIKCIISSSLYNKFKMPGIFSSFLSVVVSFISVYFR